MHSRRLVAAEAVLTVPRRIVTSSHSGHDTATPMHVAALSIISSGNITAATAVALTKARSAGEHGFDIHLVAGANVSSARAPDRKIGTTPPDTG